MAETFNPIISHLYSGQGGVSREITKYDNTTISEINFNEGGVTTKYDFGGLFNEKMFTGNRVWNQLVNVATAGGVNGTVVSYDATNGTVVFRSNASSYWTRCGGAQPIVGHKCLVRAVFTTSQNQDVSIRQGDSFIVNWTSATANTPKSLDAIFTATGDYVQFYVNNSSFDTTNDTTIKMQVFDLTLIYGAGNEPTTIAEFVHDYGDEYYPYNAGTDFSLATKLFNTIKQPLDSIKFYGNTMRWCQLVQNGNFSPSYDSSKWVAINITPTSETGGIVITNSGVGQFYQIVPVKEGHKYIFLHDCYKSGGDDTSVAVVFPTTNAGNIQELQIPTSRGIVSYMYTVPTGVTEVRTRFYMYNTASYVHIKSIQGFDLTYIFGAGNEPTTVSDFTRRLKKFYYPFTNGEILSIEKASEYLYGINIWDEEWEVGGINGDTGAITGETDRIRSKNFIEVAPNTEYNFVFPSPYARIYQYDANKQFIGLLKNILESPSQATTALNACFIRFATKGLSVVTYNNDICINLSDSSINGTYEASKGEQKMQLDSFNVWNEQWEVGGIDNTTGEKTNDTDKIRGKNYIRILPNTKYYGYNGGQGYIYAYFYDESGAFITYKGITNTEVTSPNDAAYMAIRTSPAYGTTYNNDICINISDPSRNGIYVPYRKYVELNGINDAIDTVTVEKNVTLPFGLVDLGSLNWNYLGSEGHEAMYTTDIASLAKFPASDSIAANIVCGMFSTVTRNQQYNHTADFVIAMSDDGTLYVYSTTMGTTGASFKDSVKGKYLYYELADHPLNDTPILAGSYVRKIEKVNLGTLTWEQLTSGSFRASISGGKSVADANNPSNFICGKYETMLSGWGSSYSEYDNVVWKGASSGGVCYVCIRDSAYTDATTFTAAMDGVILYYELATPVETTLTAQQCAEILNGAFTKSKYSTLLTDNNNGQIDQTVDVGMWEQR